MSNRTLLKSYFVTNAVPTAAQFAELVDSGLNTDEDSIKKLPAGPVAIEAQPDKNGVREVLHFYKDINKPELAWKMNLNALTRGSAAGLDITDANSVSRLFIKESDGSIGIGTTTPQAKLQVSNGNLYVDGKVGIGVAAPNFPLSFPNAVGQKIVLWGQADQVYGFGIVGSALQIHTDVPTSDILFGYGSSANFTERMRVKGNGNVGIGTNNPLLKLHVNGAIVATGAGTTLPVSGVVLSTENFGGKLQTYNSQPLSINPEGNNVGIGTANPRAKLEVAGGAIMPSAGNKKDSGIYFPENAGGGGGDAAWICYYDRPGDISGENMVLEIGIANDGDDHIALMPAGNVGIGTINPQAKLHVAGAIHAGGSDIYFTDVTHNHTGFGNTLGYAAIENSSNYGTLMILGRQLAGTSGRKIDMWDHLNVNGDLKINGNIVNASDKRIKQKIARSNGAEDMELLNKLTVKDYFVKSVFGEKEIQKGFIAQEVEEVLPEAVIRQTDFVADIFSLPDNAVLQEETLTLTMPQAHGLQTGDFVRLKLPNSTKDVNVTVVDDKTFSINDWKEETVTDVFVYGKRVDDFRTLNYNTIFTLGVSAIQELGRQVQQLKAEMREMTAKMTGLLMPAL